MVEKKILSTISFLPALQREFSSLSKAQQRIANFILQHPEETVRSSISQLAAATNTKSESGIVRFYRMFGFAGYNDMKVSLAMELAKHAYYRPHEDITACDSVGEVKNKIFNGAIRNLQRNADAIDEAALMQAVEILASTKRLYIMGFAISYFLAEVALFKLSKLIPACYAFCDSHVAAAMTAVPAEGDTLLAISHSGESRDLVILAENISPPAKIITITSFNDSPLARLSACKLIVEAEETYRTDAALARMSQLALIETLFLGLGIKLGREVLPMLERSHLAVAKFKY